jgi:hypothetical protein
MKNATTTTTSHIRRGFRRAKRIWSELGYAQRRLFELRTGVPVTGPAGHRNASWANIDKLEHLCALDYPVRTEH